ncbi:MAG TPA: hypothetical protein DEG92_07110 [Rikenellaceae bacterium]|nr:hypothetical protein [Rikenellaceae bacterium]
MSQTNNTVCVNYENKNNFNEQLFSNLNCYTIELEEDNKESTKVYESIICITIPIKDIIMIFQVDGFDENENIKYKLFGKVQPEHFSKDNVAIVQVSIINKFKITNVKEVYRSRLRIGYSNKTKNGKHINNFGYIYDICNFLIRGFLDESCANLKQYINGSDENSLV